MSEYERRTWETGETITADKLNHMEEGIKNAGNASYYELDLTAHTAIYGKENAEINVTEFVEAEKIMESVNAGKVVRLHWCDSAGDPVATVLLDHYIQVREGKENHYLCGMASNPYMHSYCELVLEIVYSNDEYSATLHYSTNFIPDGKPVTLKAVKDGWNITVTTKTENGSEYTDIIQLNDNGCPTSITSDGVRCAVTLEGFDI